MHSRVRFFALHKILWNGFLPTSDAPPGSVYSRQSEAGPLSEGRGDAVTTNFVVGVCLPDLL